jgi:hypothetical protein
MRRTRWIIPAGAIAAVVMIAAMVVVVGGELRGPREAARGSAQVTVFVRDSATSAQLLALDAKVGSTPGVESHVYVSKEEAMRRYAKQEGASAWVAPMNPFPASYVLTVPDMPEANAVARHVVHSPAVSGVVMSRLGEPPVSTGIVGRVLTAGGRFPGAPRPYPASEVTVADSSGRLVAIMSPDSKGWFRIELFSGDYTVDARPTAGNPWFNPTHVRVPSGVYRTVNIYAQIR